MPEEKEDRQDGEQVDPGRHLAEPGEPAVLEVSVGEGGYDLSRLEIGGDEEDGVLPHFLGDSSLLYSADAPGSTLSRRMMVFQGSVAGHQAVVLLDLGANANFVSKAGALERGMNEDLAADRYGIGIVAAPTTNLMGGAAKGTQKILPLAKDAGGPFVPYTLETLHDRSYPLYDQIFAYTDRAPGKPMDPKVKV